MKTFKLFLLFILVIAISTSDSMAQIWELQNPKPTSSQLWNTSFMNSQKGWAVGEAGTIIQTTDGGRNWTDISTDLYIDNRIFISSVHFTNEQEGWIFGYFPDDINITNYRSIILKTTDKGITWDTNFVLSDVNTSYYINATYFFDSNNIVIVGGKIVNDIPTPLMYRTTDGGTSWKQNNGDFENEIADLFSVYFIDSQNGWASGTSGLYEGRIIFKTTDGGTSWSQVYEQKDFSGYLYDIYFADALNGWTCGAVSDGFSYVGIIMKSSDGGLNWTEDNTHQSIVFRSLHFTDATNGVFAGLDVSNAIDGSGNIYQQNLAYLLKTSDGGNTFIQPNILDENNNENTINYSLQSVFFSDSQNGCSVGDAGTILTTSDCGANWYQQNKSQIDEPLTFVYFADSSNGWASGENSYNIYNTTDGGKNWKSQYYDSSFFFNSISFSDKNNGLVIGDIYDLNANVVDGAVLKTTNGGDEWNVAYKIDIERQSSYFRSVFFQDDLTGWIGGSYFPLEANSELTPLIMKTTNGGLSWALDTNGISHIKGIIFSIFFVDSDNGWACGSQYSQTTGYLVGKTIFKTTDGGTTWVNTYLEEPAKIGYLSDIQFTDKNNGWASGQTDEDGVLLRTSDGGASWTEVKLENQFFVINNPMFVDEQTGWLSGMSQDMNRSILHTENGGIDWISVSPTVPYFNSFAFFSDRKHGCAVGNNGVVSTYKYINTVTEEPLQAEYCTGEVIHVPFKIDNVLPRNITFVAQISNSNGDFSYSSVIGRSELNISGQIEARIPENIEPGNYKIRVWGSENSIDITVFEVPNPKIKGPTNACAGSLNTYELLDSFGDSVEWSVEGGSFDGDNTSNTVNVVWDKSGYGMLYVKVVKNKQSCQGIAELKVKVSNDGQVPDLKINGPEKLCNSKTNIEEYSNNDLDVINTWSVSKGKLIGDSVGSKVQIQFEHGSDTVFLHQVVLSGACINKTFKVINIDTNNITRKIIGDEAVCSGTIVEYYAQDKGENTYRWYADKATILSDDSSEKVIIRFNESGVHDLILEISSAFGCTVTNTLSVDVDLENQQIIGDSAVCKDTTLVYIYYANYKGLDCVWTIRGGDIIGPDNLDSVRVIWRKSILRTVKLQQTLQSSCSETATKIIRSRKPELTLSIPEIKVNPSEYFDRTIFIPIDYQNFSCTEDFQDTNVISIRIKIDKLSFLPVTKENISWVDEGDWRIITVNLDANEVNKNSKYDIEGYILLGNKLESPIIIDYVFSNNPELTIITINGKLILDGIPNTGGLRLLTKTSFQVQSVIPNPNDGDFRLKIISLLNQRVNIAIQDMTGNQVYNQSVDLSQGDNSIYIDNLSFPSGNYLIIIYNEEGQQSIKLLITK